MTKGKSILLDCTEFSHSNKAIDHLKVTKMLQELQIPRNKHKEGSEFLAFHKRNKSFDSCFVPAGVKMFERIQKELACFE